MSENPTEVMQSPEISIEAEMKKSYLDYAMSVIIGRALPDVRDGLKPVHRRVLYAMRELKNDYNKPYKKSARIVGDVIGKYHPHGDSAVYDTIVRLAQDFSMRYPLVDGQGNFGSIDGDPAAAMRYTEARLSSVSALMLEDLKLDTVDYVPTYDERNLEPTVLPSKFPNLLVNGAGGIAVGVHTTQFAIREPEVGLFAPVLHAAFEDNVGTELGTSGDAPSLDSTYKLVACKDGSGEEIPVIKLSTGKATLPCGKVC